MYWPDCRGWNSSVFITAGHWLTPEGHCTAYDSLPGTALALKSPVPVFRSTSPNGVVLMAWHSEVLFCQQLSGGEAWTPPTQGPHVPSSVQDSVPS